MRIPNGKVRLDAFERAATMYKKKYKKPPVLVLNNISVLNKTHPEIIQENAKENTDASKYIVVSSEGKI